MIQVERWKDDSFCHTLIKDSRGKAQIFWFFGLTVFSEQQGCKIPSDFFLNISIYVSFELFPATLPYSQIPQFKMYVFLFFLSKIIFLLQLLKASLYSSHKYYCISSQRSGSHKYGFCIFPNHKSGKLGSIFQGVPRFLSWLGGWPRLQDKISIPILLDRTYFQSTLYLMKNSEGVFSCCTFGWGKRREAKISHDLWVLLIEHFFLLHFVCWFLCHIRSRPSC